MKSTTSGYWKSLCFEVGGRFFGPFRHPIFFLYFVAFVIVIGSLGAWWPYLGVRRVPDPSTPPVSADDWALIGNLATYFIALAAATFADAHLKVGDGSKQFRFLLLVLFVVTCILGIGSLVTSSFRVAVNAVWVGSVVSLIAWWMANATNPSLRDDPPADAPTGGDAKRPLPGNLSNIEA